VPPYSTRHDLSALLNIEHTGAAHPPHAAARIEP